MKILISFLFLLSTKVFALPSDYTCQYRHYQIDLDLTQDYSTHFWLTNNISNYTVTHGYAGFIEKKGDKSIYTFYTGNTQPVKMTFKTQDVKDLPKYLDVLVETKADGILMRDDFSCKKMK